MTPNTQLDVMMSNTQNLLQWGIFLVKFGLRPWLWLCSQSKCNLRNRSKHLLFVLLRCIEVLHPKFPSLSWIRNVCSPSDSEKWLIIRVPAYLKSILPHLFNATTETIGSTFIIPILVKIVLFCIGTKQYIPTLNAAPDCWQWSVKILRFYKLCKCSSACSDVIHTYIYVYM